MAPSLLQHPLVLIATTFIVGIPVLFVAAWAGVLFSPLIIAGLLSATLAPNPPHAYRFFDWEWVDRDWRKSLVAATTTTVTTTRGGGNGGSSSSSSSFWSCYWRRAFERCHFALQLLIAGTAGFTHAFFASLVPFVAEEVGAELFALVTARRKKLKVVVVKEGGGGKGKGGGGQAVIDFEAEGTPYAYQPLRWVKYVDGTAHVAFSGGSYTNHGRFACWASGQFILGGWCGMLNAFFPWLLPNVDQEVALELGGLIVNRRKLRNKAEGFKNPENLSDMLHGEEWKKNFEVAAEAAAANGDVGNASDGHSELAQAKLKVKTGPNAPAKFL